MINSFTGEYRWLSNFWPCDVTFEGMDYSTVEAAYVAAKTLDTEIRKQIQSLSTPGKCKSFGRKIKLRDDWRDVRIDVMRSLLLQKFSYGTELATKLIDTGDCEIVEGNEWGDTFWGVSGGHGSNHLGKILMDIRRQLQARYASEKAGVYYD